MNRMSTVLPLALLIIFMILYLQVKSVATTLFVFSDIAVAWAGGYILLWLYGKPWLLDFAVMGGSMRDLFQIHPVNLSVTVWIGFLALFGMASDDGVVRATYLDQARRLCFRGTVFQSSAGQPPRGNLALDLPPNAGYHSRLTSTSRGVAQPG